MEIKEKVLMERYEVGRLLGQGNFAKVYYGRDLKSGQSVAIKVIDKDKILKSGLIDQIKREVSVMKQLEHPNIVQLYEVMATKNKIYFVLEYAKGGELFSKVAKGRVREEVARKYFQQLISAVDFCHSRGVYHRDLKLENLLFHENGDLKVADFGLSALSESKRQDGLLHTTCGTPAYVAPEIINRKGYDGAKADIWSCGVILYVLLAGHLPFHDSNLMSMYRKITRADYKFPGWFSSDLRRLVSKILDPNPVTRISIKRIMESPWFKKGLNQKLEDLTPSDHIVDDLSSAKGISSLNAFDIISLSNGFDLSGLFTENNHKKLEAKFTSKHGASTIISKLEDVATSLMLKVKKDGGQLKLEGRKEGRKGALSIEAEIFEFSPSFHLVELKKSKGDTLEYQKVLKQDIRPALKDIVWTWQGRGEQQQQEQQQ